VPRLIAKSPLAGVDPVIAGRTVLTEADPGRLVLIAPFNGKAQAVAAALGLGAAMPPPNRVAGLPGGGRIAFWGRGAWMLIGALPPESVAADAAVTDLSDGWACLRLEGPGAVAALARLVPIDLRPAAFGEGAAARTLLFHMSCAILRAGAEAFEIFVFRSMARTAHHDLAVALRSVAAQGAG
jgi:sarcosine oxidase subunit gamma